MRPDRWEPILEDLHRRVGPENDPGLTDLMARDPDTGSRVKLVGNVFRRLTATNRPLHLSLYDSMGPRDRVIYAHEGLGRLTDGALGRTVDALRTDLYPILVRSLGDKGMLDDMRGTMDLGHIVLGMVSGTYSDLHGALVPEDVAREVEVTMSHALDVLWARQVRSLRRVSVEPPLRSEGLEGAFEGCHVVDAAIRGFFGECFIEHVYAYGGAEEV